MNTIVRQSAIIKESMEYDSFGYHAHNRPVNTNNKRFKKLKSSMKKYGWLDGFPMMVNEPAGFGEDFIILDGQHRFEAAKQLGIPIKYVIEQQRDLDIAEINAPQEKWSISDYITAYVSQGNKHYAYINQMVAHTKFPQGLVISMLAGEVASNGNQHDRVKRGTFVVKDTQSIKDVLSVCEVLERAGCPFSRKRSVVCTISRILRADVISLQKVVRACSLYGGMLPNHSKEDAMLKSFEDLLNYKQVKKQPYAFLVTEKLRNRSAVKLAKKEQ